MSPDVAALERAVDRLPNTIAAGLELISRRALGDSEDARDAVQEILARAVAAIRGGRVPPEVPLGAFVHGIAKHVIADVLRRRMRDRLADHPVESLPTHHPSPLETLISGEERERVRRALARLSPNDRDLLDACFMHGARVVDIAARTGEPAERVRKRKSRALERLRALLADTGAAGHSSPSGPTLVA